MILYYKPKINKTYKWGNITLGGDNIFRVLVAYIVIFLSFFTFYAFRGYKEAIPGYMIFLQFYYFIFYTIALICAYRINIPRKEFFLFVFIYSVLSAFLIREISWEFLAEPFLGGIDSHTYDGLGSLAIEKELSFSQFLDTISYDWGIDDWGMSSIIYFTYTLTDNVITSQYLLLFFNAIIITGCGWRLDGIMRYFRISNKIRRFCVSVYAFFPFLSLTAGVGLKENFFLFIIINAFYYMFRFKETKRKTYFVYTGLFVLGCLFFRMATFAMMILSLFICLISKYKNKKKLMNLMIISAILGGIFISIILKTLFGRDVDAFLSIAQYRSVEVNDKMGSMGQWIIGFLANFFGPFANFSRISEFAIINSSGTLLKGIIGFPFLVGLISTIKNYKYEFYALFIYIILNILMTVLVAVSLDMRYQLPFFPISLIFVAKILQTKNLSQYFLIYLSLLIIMTWFYNNR